MAGVHNALSRGWLTDALKRALGVTKSEGGVERFGETLTPIVHPWGLPEWAYLRGERLGATRAVAAAVAAELGQTAIISPVDSELLIVVEAANLRGAVGFLEIATEAAIAATLAGTATAFPRDTRGGPAPNLLLPMRARLLTGTSPTAFGNEIDDMAAGVPPISLPVVLSPGWGLVLTAGTVNVAVTGTFVWRERQAFPGELA